MNIILFKAAELLENNNIKLTAQDIRANHIKKILKAKKGDNIDSGIINESVGKALITRMDTSGISLRFTPTGRPQGLHPLTLILGLSRPPTVKKILKEATAMGIQRFILCGTENGEKSYRESSLLSDENIRKVLIEGAQQACCTKLPVVELCYNLKNGIELALKQYVDKPILAGLDNYEPTTSLTAFWEKNNTAPATPAAPAAPTAPTAILAVGSERGWTANEREQLRLNHFTLCSLGTRVLRTETAAIAGTAICLSGMGLI